MQEDSFADRLREFMRVNHLSQKDVAKEVNISQASVSRALSRVPQRQGKAAARLSIYMQERSNLGFGGRGADIVVEAFKSIWDRSEAHAIAIARIIKASDGLRPAEHSEEEG